MASYERNLNALIVLIICGVLLSAFGVQFIWNEQPCPLCMLQRLGMIGVAAGCVLNIIFGIRMSHYGLILLSSLYGGTVALRQISLHVCPGFSEFGFPVLGLSLYTWSFLVFVCTVLAVALLLFLYDPRESGDRPESVNTLGKVAVGAILFVTLTNVVTTFLHCGFSVCTD